MPVTFELSQCSASASGSSGTGRSGSSDFSAMTCGGERSNSAATARKRRREDCSSACMSAHASLTG